MVFHIDVFPSSCRECVVKGESKVDIACGQFVLYPYGDGAPQRHAIGCHCVLSLCHLMYCHLPNISLCRLRKFTKSQSHPQQIPPISFIMPQLCAHGAFKITNHLSPRLFFHSLCIRSSLHSIPCRPHHRPFPGPLALAACSIHGGARGEEPLHSGGAAFLSRPVQRCRTSGAEGLGDVNGWLHPVGLHRPPPLQWEKLQSVE